MKIACASKAAANSFANLSPPCLCPPIKGITFLAFESITNIAGSFSLDLTKGEISLITAPIAPMKISEIITALVITALIRALIGLIPAILLTSPLFGISILNLGLPLAFLFLSLYIFGITLGLFVSAGLLRFGPSFENIAWSTMFLLAPFGCIYYPVEILPEIFQSIAFALPLVYIFEETRNILVNGIVSYENIYIALSLNVFYLTAAIATFYFSFDKAREKGTLINIGE